MASWQPLVLTSPYTSSQPLHRSHPLAGHADAAVSQPPLAGMATAVLQAASLKRVTSEMDGRHVVVSLFETRM